MRNSSITIFMVLALFIISESRNNCPNCLWANACFAECNSIDSYFLTGWWSTCRTRCSNRGKCAIYTNERCYCAKGCDNVVGNDVKNK